MPLATTRARAKLGHFFTRPLAPLGSFLTSALRTARSTGVFVAEKSDEEYDQYKVGKKFILNAGSLDIKDVNKLAVIAMEKRLARGTQNVPVSANLER